MSKYIPGIFGDKSTIGKRLTETYGPRKKKLNDVGKVNARTQAIINKIKSK